VPFERPDPDDLLRRVNAEQQRAQRGKLTVFFGAAPGVGKTYAMLEAARLELQREHRDVVVGVVETHGRKETAERTQGFALLPLRKVSYRGIEVSEFDLDAALLRRPQLLLVDEMAHTNVEGSRHPKRWQDIEELLGAGIDVFSTLNVQHVESLNDVVAKITSVRVRETVPDSVLEEAHEIKLVDLAPDDLLERLRDGKVYLGAQAQRAIENFFRKGNLIALRELALRHTAERVDAQMLQYRQEQGIEQTWAITDQLLVAVSPSPYSARLVRAARRMAASLRARWYAVYVEPKSGRPLTAAMAERLAANLGLAERLGAEVITLHGDDATDEILRFARARNITKLIIGKPVPGRWREHFRASIVDKVVRLSGDIDVYVTAGDPDPAQPEPPRPRSVRLPSLPSYAVALLAPTLATVLCLATFGRDQLPDVVMVYLLGIMLVSSRVGFGASLLAALGSVAAFDVFFVPPYLTFAIHDLQHVTTFSVMFVVAVVISGLTQRVRSQAEAARERELRTASLYALSRELAAAEGLEQVVRVAAREVENAFVCSVSAFIPNLDGVLVRSYASANVGIASERELSIAAWVWNNRREAGLGTSTLPEGNTLYLPLLGSREIVGVLGVAFEKRERLAQVGQRRQLDAFAAQMALAMERASLAQAADRARREMEAEQLRSSLLSSISHDLRTPLAVITGATGTLLQDDAKLDAALRQDLLRTVLEEAERLNRLIRNLLDMTRLESGAVKVNKEWLSLEELIGSALDHLGARLRERDVRVELPADLPLVPGDAVLLEQVLINLLENAAKYSANEIEIKAEASSEWLAVEVNDRGPGIAPGDETHIFDKFYRSARTGSREGVGLGLTICQAIVAVHGGEIRAFGRPGGGASFRFTLPLEHEQPLIPPAEVMDPTAQARAV
jgi:two-component system sensor histidine kinase KdpD